MLKKLNEEMLGQELKASAFFTDARSEKPDLSPTPPTQAKLKALEEKAAISSSEPKVKAKVRLEMDEKSVNRPIDQSTTESTSESTDKQVIDQTTILGRPKAFYITEKQDRDLDALVTQISSRLGGKLLFKVDRSILIRLILESSDLTSEQTIDRLAARLVSRSISQLTG